MNRKERDQISSIVREKKTVHEYRGGTIFTLIRTQGVNRKPTKTLLRPLHTGHLILNANLCSNKDR